MATRRPVPRGKSKKRAPKKSLKKSDEDSEFLEDESEEEDEDLEDSDEDEAETGRLSEEEVFFKCPYCYEEISMLLDPSSAGGEYIEDCEVCCRPIQIQFEVTNGSIEDVVAIRAQD